jgi:hypothetical protein
MPALQTINIDTLLNQQLSHFLSRHPSFNLLREHILSLKPIPSIQNTIADTVQRAAQQDIEQMAIELRNKAYNHQKNEDDSQALRDKELISNYSVRKAQILKTMIDNKNVIALNEKKLISISKEISTINNELHILTILITQRTTPHHHGHHHHVIVTEDLLLLENRRRELEKRIIDFRVEQSRTDNAIQKCKKMLETLSQEEDTIFKDEQLIRSREQERVRRSASYGQSDVYLTETNGKALRQALANYKSTIEKNCARMQNEIQQKGHLVFLDAVDHALQHRTLRLTPTESEQLKRTIDAIRIHLHQIETLHNAERQLDKAKQQLAQDNLALEKLCSSSARFNLEINSKKQQIEALTRTNKTLADKHEGLIKWRDRLSVAAFTLLGFTAAASGLSMILLAKHAVYVAMLPTAPLVLSIIATTVAGLLVAAGITWLIAAFKQQEINTNLNTIESEKDQINLNHNKIQNIHQSHSALYAAVEAAKRAVSVEESRVQSIRREVTQTYQTASSFNQVTPVPTRTARPSQSIFADAPPTYEEAMLAKNSSQNFTAANN